MTVLYSNDFEASAHLATVAAFTALGGTANYIVLDEGSFSPPTAPGGTKSYAIADAADRNYWNGGSAIGDQAMRVASYLVTGHCVGLCLRVDSAASDTCYVFYYEYSGGKLRGVIDERNSGTSNLVTGSYDVTASSGDTIHMEAKAVGSALELRIWVNSASRPSSATVSASDSTYSTGKQGLRKFGTNGTYANVDNLVITDAGGGEDFFYPTGSAGQVTHIGGVATASWSARSGTTKTSGFTAINGLTI